MHSRRPPVPLTGGVPAVRVRARRALDGTRGERSCTGLCMISPLSFHRERVAPEHVLPARRQSRAPADGANASYRVGGPHCSNLVIWPGMGAVEPHLMC